MLEPPDEDAKHEPAQEPCSDVGDPCRSLMKKEFSERLLAGALELKPKQYDLFNRFYILQQTPQQIYAETDRTPETQRQARKTLKRILRRIWSRLGLTEQEINDYLHELSQRQSW